MTPDEHAAEAERIITTLRGMADAQPGRQPYGEITANLALAQVHALLATRPTPPGYTAELTDGPTPDPVDRVFAALWDALEPDMENRPAPDTVRRWAAEAVAALTSPAPTTET